MFKKSKSIISVLLSFIKFLLIKMIRRNGFYFYPVERFSPRTMINIWKYGTLKLGKRVSAHSGVRISVTNGAVMEIGDQTAFNYNCILVARKYIKIGKNCTFGPGVIVYDHDHDFRKDNVMNGDAFVCQEIEIGENVWIGANVVILKGTIIGDNSVIAAGTVVRGTIPPNSIVYNQKEIKIKSYARQEEN